MLARVSPETAADDVTLLAALELPATDDPLVVRRGAELAVELKQHLFDTFYHAIALENSDAVLVTADEHYLRAARSKGRIMHVKDWVEGLEADDTTFDRQKLSSSRQISIAPMMDWSDTK